jgi:hypothetical protein
MFKIKCILLIAAFYSSGVCQRFGLPNYLDLASWSLSYTNNSCGLPALRYYNEEQNEFVNGWKKFGTTYPTISSQWRLNYNPDGSKASFVSSAKDQCEIVYFNGHGSKLSLYFSDHGACDYVDVTGWNFGGAYTKWVFLFACEPLYYTNPVNYGSAFKGVHAIFSYRSNTFSGPLKSGWWQCLSGCVYHQSWEKWRYFWNNWLSGQDMWTAYCNANSLNWSEMNSVYGGGLQGLEYATVFVNGWTWDNNSNCVFINGSTETVTNTFRYEMPTYNDDNIPWVYNQLTYWSTTIGNPQY